MDFAELVLGLNGYRKTCELVVARIGLSNGYLSLAVEMKDSSEGGGGGRGGGGGGGILTLTCLK